MKYNRFLPLLVPLLSAVLLEIFYFNPRMVYVVLTMMFLLFFFAFRQFILESPKNEKLRNILILPVCFSAGLVAFSTMLSSKFLVQALFLVNVVFLYFYFRAIYRYLIRTDFYQRQSLENLSSYGNFLAFYFIASAIYGIQAFLNVPVWKLMLFMLFISVLIVYQVLWANRINIKAGFFYILIIGLVLIELAWSASFLTLSYYVLGLILAVSYYIIIGITRFYLLGRLNKKLVKMYLVFGFGSILIVLLTSRWV